MMTSQKISSGSLLILCFVSILASAQTGDVPGSKDHPLLARYPGSVIVEYSAKEFDEFLLPPGKLNSDGKFARSQRLEGEVTRIRYQFPKNRSVLEVSRNHDNALQNAGFQILFTGVNEECGYGNFHLTSDKAEAWYASNERQFSGKLSRSNGDAYVSLHVVNQDVRIDIIEMKPMDKKM